MKLLYGFACASQLFVIKDLVNTYVDICLSRTRMIESFSENCLGNGDAALKNPMGFRFIPVKLPNKKGEENAVVSTEDYKMLSSIQWRKSSSGYALGVLPVKDGTKDRTVYMHKLVFGKPAKHINGNRLDNRRENLANTNRVSKRKRDVNEEDEFDLKTPRAVSIDVHTYKQNDPNLTHVSGYGVLQFDNGKTYSGDIEKGLPHGYGILNRNDIKAYDMFGQWVYGKMEKGIVTNYDPIPRCMCETPHSCPFRNVTTVQVIHNGHYVKD